MATQFYRVAFRRHLEALRLRRLPQGTRRHQSSAPKPPNATSDAVKAEDPIPAPGTIPPLPFWQRLGPLTRAAEAFGRSQRKWPYRTQLVSTLIIYLTADISAQQMSGKDYDPKRTVRSLIIGGVAAIPNYKWFMWLSNNFNYPSRVLSIATKVVVSQILFTPIFNSYFFGAQALLSGDTPAEAWDRIKRTVPVTIVNSAKFWPPVTAFSFAFIPLEYRSLFAGTIAVGWQTYLAYLNRQAELVEELRKAAALPEPASGKEVEKTPVTA